MQLLAKLDNIRTCTRPCARAASADEGWMNEETRGLLKAVKTCASRKALSTERAQWIKTTGVIKGFWGVVRFVCTAFQVVTLLYLLWRIVILSL